MYDIGTGHWPRFVVSIFLGLVHVEIRRQAVEWSDETGLQITRKQAYDISIVLIKYCLLTNSNNSVSICEEIRRLPYNLYQSPAHAATMPPTI